MQLASPQYGARVAKAQYMEYSWVGGGLGEQLQHDV